MAYRVTRSAAGRPVIELSGEPPYCHALAAAPPELEPELRTGLWLILVFAVWSVPDVAAVQTALDVAERFRGAVKLGLRPFYGWEEHAMWCPGLGEDGQSPLWLLLRDGEPHLTLTGHATVDDLVRAIAAAEPSVLSP